MLLVTVRLVETAGLGASVDSFRLSIHDIFYEGSDTQPMNGDEIERREINVHAFRLEAFEARDVGLLFYIDHSPDIGSLEQGGGTFAGTSLVVSLTDDRQNQQALELGPLQFSNQPSCGYGPEPPLTGLFCVPP